MKNGSLKRFWTRINVLEEYDFGFLLESIECPECKKTIRWNNKWRGYVCNHHKFRQVYEIFIRDEKDFIVELGGITKRIPVEDNNSIVIINEPTKEAINNLPENIPPIVKRKYETIYVKEKINNKSGKVGSHLKVNWDKDDLKRFWTRINVLEEYDFGFLLESIECPKCNKIIRWDSRWGGYVCKHNNRMQVYAIIETGFYGKKTKNKTKPIIKKRQISQYEKQRNEKILKNLKNIKLKEKQENLKKIRKYAPYRCGYDRNCKFRCGSFERLVEHYQEKHSFKPRQTTPVTCRKKSYEVAIKEYIIIQNYKMLPTILDCPNCDGTARLNLKTHKYICGCGVEITGIREYQGDALNIIDDCLKKINVKTIYDLVKNSRCSHCGAKINVTKDKKNLICSSFFGCPLYKENYYRNRYGMSEIEFKSLSEEQQKILKEKTGKKKTKKSEKKPYIGESYTHIPSHYRNNDYYSAHWRTIKNE